MRFIEDHKFESFSVNDGLSQNTVYSIIQDRKGFLWICTQLGLNRFSGYEFEIYKNDPNKNDTIQNNYIYTSFKDSGENLWFGSLDGTIINYNEIKNSFYNYNIPLSESHTSVRNHISSICERSPSEYYIALFGKGLFLFLKDQDRFINIPNDIFDTKFDMSDIKTLYAEDQDILWAGTWDNGLLKLDLKNNTARQFTNNPTDDNSLCNNRIKFIFRDTRGDMWVGTAQGLNRYDSEKNKFHRYLHSESEEKKNVLTSIAEDRNGNIWLGTINSGLIKFDRSKDNFTFIRHDPGDTHGLSSDAVISLYADSSNVLWIGTFNDGLSKLDCERKKFFSLRNLTDRKKYSSKYSVGAILKDGNGDIYFGTDFEGLFKISTDTNTLESILLKSSLSESRIDQKDQTILSLLKGDSDELWAGTLKYGLYEFNTVTNKSGNYFYTDPDTENQIHSLCSSDNRSGRYIWAGTLSEGLFRFDKLKKAFTKYSDLRNFNRTLSSERIKCLLTDWEGILWIGTDMGGLNRLDPERGLITHYKFDKDDPDSVSDNYIISMMETGEDVLWVGTMNKGLNRFDKKSKTFRRFTADDGLPDNTIRGIMEDETGNLWISTNNGLCRFDPVNITFRNYNIDDGLQSKEFNDGAYYKDEEGSMYFGGVNGFNFFHPRDIKDNPYVPETVITDFRIFNKSVCSGDENSFIKKNITETKEIILSYRESVFSFEFAALIYNNPSRNQYSYMMEGFDREWIFCGTRRFATYTNLEPGEYIFRVRGSNNDGVWNLEGTSIKIVITPPFWKTWWFRSLGIASVIGATGIAYQQKLSKIEKEKRSQEDFSRKLLESQEMERKKIASELHDTIAHDILVTKNKAVIGLKKADDKNAVKKILSEISELASGTLNDVRSISYNLHPHLIDRLGISKAIRSVINAVANSSEIIFTCNIENIDNILSKELELNLFRIIQECTSNILKHSIATEASLNILKDNRTLIITVWDNGKGISRDRIDGLGLTGIAERVKLYNGELVIESAQSKGTVIILSLPIKTQIHENKK